jgi:cardiolipin synthase (CMP-forming)
MAAKRPRLIAAVPNALTVGRLVVAVAFPFSPAPWRLWLVLAGGLSDALDGFIARRFHATSWTGALLDGIADKAFTLSILATFTIDEVLRPWQLVLLLARDIAVGLMAAYGAMRREWWGFRVATARPLGKMTTVALVGFMLAVFVWEQAAAWLLWAAMALSLAAAADYFRAFVAARKAGTPKTNEATG